MQVAFYFAGEITQVKMLYPGSDVPLAMFKEKSCSVWQILTNVHFVNGHPGYGRQVALQGSEFIKSRRGHLNFAEKLVKIMFKLLSKLWVIDM